MKIVFLNALHGELTSPLREFLQKHRDTTDVFCFQEAGDAMQALIQEILPSFVQVSARKPEPSRTGTFYNATVVHASHATEASSSNDGVLDLGLTLYASVRCRGKLVHIANVHGLTRPGKLDNPNRLRQSQEILDTMESLEGIKIIGGDFNVLLDTRSVQIFEDAGYKNPIREYGITTTRNHLAWDKHPGEELYYSDYVFTKGAQVASFEVPQEIVSDHQPMIVTIALE